jgi:hypothetical protein
VNKFTIIREELLLVPFPLLLFALLQPAGQEAFIAEAREIALHYTRSLPNFVCDQVTERYVNPRGDKKKEQWKRLDRITTRLTFNGVAENYELTSINGRPVHDRSLESVGGTIAKGDFASALRFVFAPASEAKFEWELAATLRNRECDVFRYAVDQTHSRLRITEGGTGEFYQTAYRGTVYIDRETKRTLRLTLQSEGIPPSFPIQSTSQQLDYDFAEIGGERYLLPFDSDVRLTHGRELSRNVSRYENYRKFSADANITFK